MGSYDECIKIKATIYDNPVNKTGYIGNFDGKYCTAILPAGPAAAGGGQQVLWLLRFLNLALV